MPNVNFPNQNAQKVASLWNTDHALADEGSYYIATNPTSGTGIATTTSVIDDAATASATHAQNVPVMYIHNASDPTNALAKTIYLRYLRMIVTSAPTSATDWNMSLRADNVNRYTSGGTGPITAKNINTAYASNSSALIYFGAVVTTALPSASARLLGRAQVQSSIPVVKDQWMITFGDTAQNTNVLTASAAKNINVPMGPIMLSPGWGLAIGMWGTACAAAPAWEFELGYVERQSGL